MGEPAVKLSHGQMMYNGRPRMVRSDIDVSRLTMHLISGHVMCQPWYRGRRLIYLPDRVGGSSSRGLFTPTGIPYNDLGDDVRVDGPLPLELVLVRSGKIKCVDVMIPHELEERLLLAKSSTPEPVYWRVRGVAGAQTAMNQALSEGYDGVLFKDARVRYPWLPFGSQHVDGWWVMKRRTG